MNSDTGPHAPLDRITTLVGVLDRRKFEDLVELRAEALSSVRDALSSEALTEVLAASLVNIAGSCENPAAAFEVNYYGRAAHLSQSAQIQLETLVARLRRGFFTVSNSFRAEDFDDPDHEGRRLSEFTLVEAELPVSKLSDLTELVLRVLKRTVQRTLERAADQCERLGGDPDGLQAMVDRGFTTISHSQALGELEKSEMVPPTLTAKDERLLLDARGGNPLIVTHHPLDQKFFNIKALPEGGSASFDVLAPPLGEVVGGGLREEDPEVVRRQLADSSVGQFLANRGEDPEAAFDEYFYVMREERPIAHGGFGIGFERLIAWMIGSTDIIHTITHRVLAP